VFKESWDESSTHQRRLLTKCGWKRSTRQGDKMTKRPREMGSRNNNFRGLNFLYDYHPPSQHNTHNATTHHTLVHPHVHATQDSSSQPAS